MISAENLTKSFGAHVLFDKVSFKINSRERVGLVGQNGHGKTTLFNIIIGEEEPESGSIVIPRNYRIGHVRQQIAFTRDTVLEEGMTGLAEHERDQFWKVEKILAGLGFSADDMQRHPGEFSGGYQVRLNLAKVLVSEPDMLLLDEPTNYLDITSIRWVERFLNRWPRELMLITHDRGFMDRVVSHIIGIHRKRFRKIPGDTGKYYAQIAQEEEVHEKTRINDEKRRKEVELFITRFRAKARLASMVQSRVKTLEKTEKKEKLEKLKTLDFSFRSKPFQGKTALSARNLSFSYESSQPLISDFDITVRPGDRICVVGKNGAGKTTLVKLMAGKLTPQQGEVTYHPKIESGFFEQTNVETLVDERTIEEEILYSSSDVDRQQARNICGAMMFEGDAALKRIAVLSGGEKSRVMLGKLLVTPVNLLLLDEPTNHLDMESTDAMLAALDSFPGTVIMVTHNETFLHTLADRLVVFQNENVTVFEGGYQGFLEKGGWHDTDMPLRSNREPSVTEGPTEKLSRKEIKRRRSEYLAARARALKPIEQRIARTEKAIKRGEAKLADLNGQMLEASQGKDGSRLAALSQAIHQCREETDKHYDELETLTSSLDEQKAIFEKEHGRLAPASPNRNL